MIDHPDDADLDGLLQPPPVEPDPRFRSRVLKETKGVLRRRVWGRRLLLVAACTACYAVGLGTIMFLRSASPPQPETPSLECAPPSDALLPGVMALEDRALQFPDRRGDLYREAGQRYLQEHHDVQSALRCYGQALDSGTDKDLTVNPEDDWLLIALKHARQEEKRYARQE
jgi:hypothetical protein